MGTVVKKNLLYRYIPLVLLICIGIVSSVLLFKLSFRYEQAQLQEDFEKAAEDRISILKRRIEENIYTVERIADFYAGSQKVEWKEFRAFVQAPLARHSGIQALEWIPRVTDRQRVAYETAAQKDGFSNFQITERQSQGYMVRANKREEYFPVYFVEPYIGNEMALGFDLASNPIRLEALKLACDTGKAVATAQIVLAQETAKHSGFLIFSPIYHKDAPTNTIEDRRNNLQGLALGVFRVGDILENALAYLEPRGINMYLYDASAPVGRHLLASHSSRTSETPADPTEYEKLDKLTGLHEASTINVANRKWLILCTPTAGFVADAKTWQPWILLTGGLVFTAMLTVYIILILVHNSKTRQVAAKILSAKKQLVNVNKQLEVSIERANLMAEEALAANQTKSNFLANMSHKIRTPMNAVIGFSEILKQDGLTCEQKKYVSLIYDSGKHLLKLIDNILDLSKIEAGKLETEIIDCDLANLLGDVESLMRPAAIDKGLKFEVLQCGQLPAKIRTDCSRLRQCLINLTNNAIKFTEQGHVYLNTSLETCENKPYIRFDVEDTGIGIPADKQKYIFEAFSQVDSSTTRRFGGTGLGLAITKQLIELLGGKISIVSTPGKGAVFSIVIPAGIDTKSTPAMDKYKFVENISAETDIADEQKFTGRILVAEDNRSNQMLMDMLLQKMGLDVTVAEDGQKAVEKASSEPFDLIFMDMQMPVMSGYDAARKLRAKGLKTPIIALIAHAMKGDAEKCIQAGCDAYISKPVDRKEINETIAKYLAPAQTSLPDSSTIAEAFVNKLPEMIEKITDAADKSDLLLLKVLTAELKAAGKNAGAEDICEKAGQIEQFILASQIDAVKSTADELTRFCRQTSTNQNT